MWVLYIRVVAYFIDSPSVSLQVLQNIYGVLEYAANAHVAEEVHDVGVVALRHDPDVRQVRRK